MVNAQEVKVVALAGVLFDLTEERKTEVALGKRRFCVNHSLTLHRDSASADDVRAMIDHLAAAGMPGHATLRVDGTREHTRMHATWHTGGDDR